MKRLTLVIVLVVGMAGACDDSSPTTTTTHATTTTTTTSAATTTTTEPPTTTTTFDPATEVDLAGLAVAICGNFEDSAGGGRDLDRMVELMVEETAVTTEEVLAIIEAAVDGFCPEWNDRFEFRRDELLADE